MEAVLSSMIPCFFRFFCGPVLCLLLCFITKALQARAPRATFYVVAGGGVPRAKSVLVGANQRTPAKRDDRLVYEDASGLVWNLLRLSH